MIEIIKNQEKVYAIIIRANYNNDGYNFFTEDSASMQIGSLIL